MLSALGLEVSRVARPTRSATAAGTSLEFMPEKKSEEKKRH
jgi:hypothetical protein